MRELKPCANMMPREETLGGTQQYAVHACLGYEDHRRNGLTRHAGGANRRPFQSVRCDNKRLLTLMQSRLL